MTDRPPALFANNNDVQYQHGVVRIAFYEEDMTNSDVRHLRATVALSWSAVKNMGDMFSEIEKKIAVAEAARPKALLQ